VVWHLLEEAPVKTKMALSAIVGSLVLAGLGCSGAPIGGRGTGGSGGDGPCPDSTRCGTGAGGDIATGGTSGADASDSALCRQLTDAYGAAVTAALACTPGAPKQCQALVAIAPTACPGLVCGGQELVNDATEVETLRGEWLDACEPGVRIGCVAIACAQPLPPSVCVPTGGAGTTTGTCVPYGSDAGAAVVPDGGESCDQLVADYEAAVTAALACTPGAPNQCQSYVSTTAANGPDPSDCRPMTVVNDLTRVNAALQRWSAQCFTGGPILLIKCDPPTQQASCVPNVDAGAVSGSAGTCVPTILD
jgi:hypothetical protein